MTEIKHTPDLKQPWRYDQHRGAGEGFILNAEGNVVGQVRGWGWMQKEPEPENLQDAHGHVLGASAELLDALTGLGALPEGYCFCPWHRDATLPDEDHTGECRAARAAIAKAEGRS